MTNPAEHLLVVHLTKLEARVEQLQRDLLDAHARNATLRRQVESLRSTLKGCRASRDEWKRRAKVYQHKRQIARQRVYYARQQRDMWKLRALRREVEAGEASPQSRGHLSRMSKAWAEALR